MDKINDDTYLVQKYKDGNDDAFETLIKKYQNRIFSVLFRLLGDEEVSKDLVQETFIKIYHNIKHFEGKSSFFTWLYRIAVNTALQHMSTKSYNVFQKSVSFDDLKGTPVDNSLDKDLLNKELIIIINNVVKSLPHELKVTFVLREFEGLSYNEIAEVQKCPIGTVRSRLFRARGELLRKISLKGFL